MRNLYWHAMTMFRFLKKKGARRFSACLWLSLAVLVLLHPLQAEANQRGGIEFAFTDVRVVKTGSQSYLNLDVTVKGSNSVDRLGTGIVLINYNPSVFGYNVKNNNNLIVSRGSLLSTQPANYYNLYVMDSLPTRFAVTYEYITQPGYGNQVSQEFQQLLNLKIRIQNRGLPAGISFHSNAMSVQQYLDDNATLFNPVISVSSIADIIPSAPVAVDAVIQGSTLNLSWPAITGCTYKVYASADPEINSWMLAADHLSTNQWSCDLTSERRFFYVTAHSGSFSYQIRSESDH